MVRAISSPSSMERETKRSPDCTIWSRMSTRSSVTRLALPLTTTATRSAKSAFGVVAGAGGSLTRGPGFDSSVTGMA